MASQTFAAGSIATVSWWNDVNDHTYDDVINVKNSVYGVTGDGSTDDTAAIQAALNAAAAGGKPIVFPAGTYKITSGLTCGAPIRIIGAGSNATRILFAAISGTAFRFTNDPGSFDNGLNMSGFLFEQQNARSGSATGLHFEGIVWPNTRVQDLQVINFGGPGIYIEDCINSSFECIRSAGNGGVGWNIDKSNGVSLYRCSAESNRSNGFSWANSGTSGERFGPEMIACHAEENCGHALVANTTRGLLINGGWWQVAGLNPSDGSAQANAFACFSLDQTEHVVISGARITTGGNTSLLMGVHLSGALYGTVSNSMFFGFGAGLDVVGTTDSGRNFVFACAGSGSQGAITYTDSSSTGNVYSNHLGSGASYGMEQAAGYHSFRTVAGTNKLVVDASGIDLAGHTTGTVAPSAGGAGALPATPLGYVTLKINGTARKVAFY